MVNKSQDVENAGVQTAEEEAEGDADSKRIIKEGRQSVPTILNGSNNLQAMALQSQVKQQKLSSGFNFSSHKPSQVLPATIIEEEAASLNGGPSVQNTTAMGPLEL